MALPPERPFDPNPLGLPPATAALRAAEHVFAVPPRMLEHAREGSSLMLRRARVELMDGAQPIVRIGHGPAYPIHPGYLVVPKPGRWRRGQLVIAPYRDELHHAIVKGQRGDRILCRLLDVGAKLGEVAFDPRDLGVLAPGLAPGGYAVLRAEHGLRRVLLVSVHAGDRWLTLGAHGEARLVDARSLTPLPHDFRPKVGTRVQVEHRGVMVPGTVQAVHDDELFVVRRDHEGPAVVAGLGLLLPTPGN